MMAKAPMKPKGKKDCDGGGAMDKKQAKGGKMPFGPFPKGGKGKAPFAFKGKGK